MSLGSLQMAREQSKVSPEWACEWHRHPEQQGNPKMSNTWFGQLKDATGLCADAKGHFTALNAHMLLLSLKH